MSTRGGRIIEKLGTTSVELQERSSRPYIWLDVSYNGKYPPTELFADLEMIGWTPPAPGPPPRAAIDWDTPNAATGDPFSIRDYQVDDTIKAPDGSGDHGRWTPGERAAYLRGLDGVLKRHGLLDEPEPASPPPVAAAAPPTPPAPPPASPAAAQTPADTNADEVTPAAGEPGRPVGTTLVHIDALLVPGARQVALQAMSSLDLPARVEIREITKTVQFRGSATTTNETGQVLSSILAASEVPRVTAVLVNAKAVADEDAVVVAPLQADTLATFLAPPAAGDDEAAAATAASGAAPDRTTLVITLRASVFGLLRETIDDVGGTIRQRVQTKLSSRVNHRGSVREMTVAGVRVTIEIDQEHLAAVLDAAQECGVDVDDPEAVIRVEAPNPPAPDSSELTRRLLEQSGGTGGEDAPGLLDELRSTATDRSGGAAHDGATMLAP